MKTPQSRDNLATTRLLKAFVALSLIAIIAAILFPIFQKVREGGGPSCASNLKQLGLAYVQYTMDNSGQAPSGV